MTNGSKGNETDETVSARYKIKNCEKLGDKEKQLKCLYKTLHDVTETQDIVNLSIYKTINNEEDPRWIPTLMADNANAILLEISHVNGHPQSIIRHGGYVEEKMNSLMNRWYSLKSKYRE